MTNSSKIVVFGEVLFDCFPSGEKVLGGAPFNVAWHLQALGDAPLFVSRIGEDADGFAIASAMEAWGMDTSGLQRDPVHPTGSVQVALRDGEPRYTITPDVAYDFIEVPASTPLTDALIVYHGSLALRNPASRAACQALTEWPNAQVFVDVNLRAPWWNRQSVMDDLQRARWAKLNVDELRALGFDQAHVDDALRALQSATGVHQVILTRGKQGAAVLTAGGQVEQVPPAPLERRVDPVGAGDAFSAIYLHGLLADWPVRQRVERAQEFAACIISQRGATPQDPALYAPYRTDA